MTKHLARFLLAASSSGSGKTLLTCGILQALIRRGHRVASFKCGPDYIDPMFHTKVVGTRSRNLDTFFSGENTTRYLLAKNCQQADLAVMEGVMGFYDGVGTGTQASSYDLARVTSTPVVLLVNGKGMSLSIAALIQGMMRFRGDSNIQGVILNQVSQKTCELLRPVIERECGVRVLGYVPNVKEYVLESRHLGLVTPEEVVGLKEKLESLAGILETCIDLDVLLEIAGGAPDFEYEEPEYPRLPLSVRVGVARDSAFCFYYEDNLTLLQDMGAELVEFSPLTEEHLPEGLQALIFGGGYPEIYAEKLSANRTMRQEIKAALDKGMPCLAECGGFMYLHEEMEDMQHCSYPMVGAVAGKVFRTEKLGRFGYINLTAEKDQLLGPQGLQVRGHEFHYFDSTNCGDVFTARKPSGDRFWSCMHGTETLAVGFPHLYYYSNPGIAYEFLKKGAEYVAE